jgi:hypothetical protein
MGLGTAFYRSSVSPGQGSRGQTPVTLQLYRKLQGYFGYENDRTHVIKVVVLVVKTNTQLTYGIHGINKKEVM